MVTLPSQGTILLTSLPVEKEVKIIVYLEKKCFFSLKCDFKLKYCVMCTYLTSIYNSTSFKYTKQFSQIFKTNDFLKYNRIYKERDFEKLHVKELNNRHTL